MLILWIGTGGVLWCPEYARIHELYGEWSCAHRDYDYSGDIIICTMTGLICIVEPSKELLWRIFYCVSQSRNMVLANIFRFKAG